MAGGGRRTALLAGIVVAMVAAPSAHAAKLSQDRDSGVLTFTSEPGEVNHVAVTYDPAHDEYTVTDTGGAAGTFSVSVGSRSGCRAAANGATCTGSRLTAIQATLGDLDDSLTVDADKPVRVNGGAGSDAITTGFGDDSIDGGAGADRIACGGGTDSVVADPADSFDSSCEGGSGAVDGNPPAPGDPGTTGGGDPGVPTSPDGTPLAAPDIVLPVRPVTLGAPGIVQVELGCAAEAAAVCSGDIYVEAPARYLVRRDRSARAARGSHTLRQRRLGQRRFRVEPGKTATTSVPVLRGHYILRNRRKRVRGRVLIVQRDAAGKVLGTISRPVVLERKWSRRASQRRR